MGRRAKGDGSVFQQSDGRWIGRLDLGPDPRTGKRRRRKVTGTSKARVSKRLRELRAEVDAGVDAVDQPTIGDLTDRWLERVASRKSVATLDMYQRLARTHLAPLASVKVGQLTVRHVEDWLDARSHLSRSTLTKLRSMLGQILDYARRYRIVTVNVARDAELPPAAEQSRHPRSLTRDEAAQLLAAGSGLRLEAWLHVMLGTGARPGEVAALTWFDVDLDAGTIRVVATKTGGQVRVLRVAPSVVNALHAHRLRQTEERLLMGDLWPSEHDALVFRSQSGTPLDAANARRFVRSVAKDAGIDHLTPYELRHSHASILSDAEVHVEALADRMGHKDSRTTLTYYRHQLTPVIEVGSEIDFAAG
jgi:integrase